MNRPLLPSERVAVELVNLEGSQSPALTDLFAATMFQMGLLLGAYPTGRVQVVLERDEYQSALVMQITMTVPLEELGA